jgi:hypothetical protein
VTDDELLSFVSASIKSVWALELLVLLQRDPTRSWSTSGLIGELRGSEVVISAAMDSLIQAGLAIREAGGNCRYAATSDMLNSMTSDVARLYAEKPMMVIKAIVSSPDEKLRLFSNAFKFKS